MAELIELPHALELVRGQVSCNDVEVRRLDETLGCVLAEDVLADTDVPPYDKAMVDGFAVAATDLATGSARLRLVEDIWAGHVPQQTLARGQAARIMTGAPLPAGADAVVMVEQSRAAVDAPGWVELTANTVSVGQNVMRRAAAMQAGRAVLARGQRVRAVEVGLLAEAGRSEARVIRPPRVATIQTGDELVDVDQPLGPGQIRNSNGPLLRAMIRQAGGVVDDLGIVADQTDLLLAAVHQGLAADILVLSGGVSQGDRDLVPRILIEAGVECVFHKVQLRPGKPLWFGVRRQAAHRTLVFGLPGNPVSGLVCCRLFVIPTLHALAGRPAAWDGDPRQESLSSEFVLRGGRPTYWPGRRDRSRQQVAALDWLGSADPFALAHSDCLIFFAEGNRTYAAGEKVPVISLDG